MASCFKYHPVLINNALENLPTFEANKKRSLRFKQRAVTRDFAVLPNVSKEIDLETKTWVIIWFRSQQVKILLPPLSILTVKLIYLENKCS